MSLIESFLSSLSSYQTRRAYRTDLHRFFQQTEVDPSIVQSIEADGIQSFIRGMQRKSLSVATQRRRLAAIRRFYDWLVQEGIASYNPARQPRVEPLEPEVPSDESGFLDKEDVEALLRTAAESASTGLRDQTLILTIVYAALRRSEIAALEVDDVRPLGRHWVIDLETGGYVRVPETVVEAIEKMKDAYGVTSGPLWRSLSNQNRGEPMSPDAIYKVVRRVSDGAGLRSVSIDDLRQAGLQLAIDGGADLPQVQAHGRFSDPASAARAHDTGARSGPLAESAAEYIDLEVSGILGTE